MRPLEVRGVLTLWRCGEQVSVSKETLEATAGEVLDLLFQVIDGLRQYLLLR